jgi:1-acyl-sn-glycerol-3-phosphate acyltransferase
MLKPFLMLIFIIGYLFSTSILAIGQGGTGRAMNNGSLFCKWVLKLLGIRVNIHGKAQNGIIVANHLSYVDILAILSVHPTRFVSFIEMAQLPGIGWITAISQTLFVNRSNPKLIKNDVDKFETELRKGMPFVFFPEGASFDGSELQPFKSSLFESAVRANLPVQPLCLRYTEVNGEPLSLKNRDLIFYHGDMQLIPQLFGLLKLKSVKVELVFCESITSTGKSRKDLALAARQEISKHFRPVPQ